MTDNISRMYKLAGIKNSLFTEIKQFELLRWMFFNKYKQYFYFVNVIFKTKEEKRIFFDSEYPQRLAKLVCELWEDLTEKQREEVRGILQ